MAKLQRKTQKIFAGGANADQIAVFGTMKTGTPEYSTDVETLQSEEYSDGWSEAILEDKAPYLEEMNGVQYGLSYQTAYILQEGIPEYDAGTNYSNTAIVKEIVDGTPFLYVSQVADNLGHVLSDITYWKPYKLGELRNIGEVITSTIPLTDAGLHLLDGSLIDGAGIYGTFVTYIANLYNAGTANNCFTTEVLWQSTVASTGYCDKYVYDSNANTVRLPKLGSQLLNNLPSTIGVKGNNMGVGLTNGTNDVTLSYYYNSGAGSQFTIGQAPLGSLIGATNTVASGTSSNSQIVYGLTSDKTKSGIVADASDINSSKVYYYVVIATSAKTSIEVDIDEIATDLNGKADVDLSNCTKPYVIETSPKSILPNWWRIWSNGWCEQGGFHTENQNTGWSTINLLKNYTNTDYEAFIQTINSYNASSSNFSTGTMCIKDKTTSSFMHYYYTAADGYDWKAEGYLAEGE